MSTALLVGALEYSDCISAEGGKTPPNVYPKLPDSDSPVLENVEYPFITIASISTLTQTGST